MKHWQAELVRVRTAWPSPYGRWVAQRSAVLDEAQGRRCGGARYAHGVIGVSVELEEAPPAVRRYLMAHEWGHVVSRHGMMRYVYVGLSFGLIPLAAFACWRSSTLAFAGWLMLVIGLLGLLRWMLAPRREHEADAVAVAINGLAETCQACHWMTHWLHEPPSALRDARLAQLGHARLASAAKRGAKLGPLG